MGQELLERDVSYVVSALEESEDGTLTLFDLTTKTRLQYQKVNPLDETKPELLGYSEAAESIQTALDIGKIRIKGKAVRIINDETVLCLSQ